MVTPGALDNGSGKRPTKPARPVAHVNFLVDAKKPGENAGLFLFPVHPEFSILYKGDS
jgi:hypothetical protein